MTSEFELIAHYFNRPGLGATATANIRLGIGDDCALLSVPAGHELALSMDVLVEGVHFPADAAPAQIAQRALRINLSDLAAMGAEPLCFTLGLTLPACDAEWLQEFSDGLLSCSTEFACPLIGGNTTRGPLQIAIQVHGTVPSGKALTRSGAAVGDLVFVSGKFGAAAAVAVVTGRHSVDEHCRALFDTLYYRPEPRLPAGRELRGIASACIDVSDGLLADLQHIAEASGVRIMVHADQVPLHDLSGCAESGADLLAMALAGGDDYELAFTVPAARRGEIDALSRQSGISLTCIGRVVDGAPGTVECLDARGQPMAFAVAGYRHF